MLSIIQGLWDGLRAGRASDRIAAGDDVRGHSRSMTGRRSRPRRRGAGPVLEPLEGRALLTGVTYHGGPLLTHVEIQPIFLGSAWTTNPILTLNENQVVGELTAMVQDRGYLNLVGQYGIGSGTVSAPLVATWQNPQGVVDDLPLRKIIGDEIAAGRALAPDANRLYVVFTAPGVKLEDSAKGFYSWSNANAWHDYGQDPVNTSYNLVYAVMPYPGNGNTQLVAGAAAVESLEPNLFHEVAEASTDPVLGTGWLESTSPGYEIGDFNNYTLVWDGVYYIQGLFSNSAGTTVFPSPTMPAAIEPRQGLAPGQSYFAPDDRFHLIMQGDGNLAEYGPVGQFMWNSGTSGNPGAYAIMQADGNLVVYSGVGQALWNSHTYGNPGASLMFWSDGIGSDGNLVIDASNGTTPLWSSQAMEQGQFLNAGSQIDSPDGQFELIMQGDGNLVEYRVADRGAMWNSGTAGNPGAYAVMQGDGNLVVYSGGGRALWDSHTAGNPGASLAFLDDGDGSYGNLVIDASNGTTRLWSSEAMEPGQRLTAGQYITSPNGQYHLIMQGDGNLVEYRVADGQVMWYSGTAGYPGAYAVMQGDGNLVVYSGGGRALGYSGTAGNPGAHLSIGDNGLLTIVNIYGQVILKVN